MSAADRMTVRKRDGKVVVVPRKVGLGLIARNQAKAERSPRGGTVSPRQVVASPGRVQRTPNVHIETVAPVPAVTVPRVDAPWSPTLDDEVRPAAQRRDLPEIKANRGRITFAPDAGDVDEDPTALPVEAPEVEKPKGNASRKIWADYAHLHGVTVTDDMNRNAIRDAVVAKLESDRMSQPAFTDLSVEGGRLATPEDEPVTSEVVTSGDPGARTA